MPNNKSIQILRGSRSVPSDLLSGQPYYSKTTNQLYIGGNAGGTMRIGRDRYIPYYANYQYSDKITAELNGTPISISRFTEYIIGSTVFTIITVSASGSQAFENDGWLKITLDDSRYMLSIFASPVGNVTKGNLAMAASHIGKADTRYGHEGYIILDIDANNKPLTSLDIFILSCFNTPYKAGYEVGSTTGFKGYTPYHTWATDSFNTSSTNGVAYSYPQHPL